MNSDIVTLASDRVLLVVNGMKMFLDGRDYHGQTPILALDRMKEPALTDLVIELAKQSECCADVGATFGYYTLLMAKHCKKPGRVFSFEPHPRNFPLVKASVMLNRFKHCKVYPNACGAQSSAEYVQLSLHRRQSEFASMCPAAIRFYGDVSTHAVQVISLDDVFVGNRMRPDLVMISTEGYEPKVWEGMRNTIALGKPQFLIIDYRPRWYEDESFAQSVIHAGYRVKQVFSVEGFPVVSGPDNLFPAFRSFVFLQKCSS